MITGTGRSARPFVASRSSSCARAGSILSLGIVAPSLRGGSPKRAAPSASSLTNPIIRKTRPATSLALNERGQRVNEPVPGLEGSVLEVFAGLLKKLLEHNRPHARLVLVHQPAHSRHLPYSTRCPIQGS